MRLKLNMIVRPGIVIKSLMNIRTISSVHNRFELWTLAFLFSAQPNIAVGYMRYMGPAIIYYIAKWLLPAGYFGG